MSAKRLLALFLGVGIFLVLANVLLAAGAIPLPIHLPHIAFRNALWIHRSLDVLGQLALLITGTYSVLLLVRERH